MDKAKSVRLMLTGDNMILDSHPNPTQCYAGVVGAMREADLRFGNLELPLTEASMALDPQKVAQFKAIGANTQITRQRMDVKCIDALKLAGYDAVSLANNHHMAYGAEGSARTRELLQRAGIKHCGAGADLREATRAAVLECKGLRFAFLSYTMVCLPQYAATETSPGMAVMKIHTTYSPPARYNEQPGTPMKTHTFADPEAAQSLRANVEDARRNADIVVCAFHWGVSVDNLAAGVLRQRAAYQAEVGRLCIDAGATVVVGHHPHVLQGVECYKGGVICYSLGNFVLASGGAIRYGFPPEGVIADCTLSKDGIAQFSFIPLELDEDTCPHLAGEEFARGVHKVLESDSREFGTGLHLHNGKIVVTNLSQPV
jgi:poly-gamma-glutamate synthesis protein (capsule biosynthesis protein)